MMMFGCSESTKLNDDALCSCVACFPGLFAEAKGQSAYVNANSELSLLYFRRMTFATAVVQCVQGGFTPIPVRKRGTENKHVPPSP